LAVASGGGTSPQSRSIASSDSDPVLTFTGTVLSVDPERFHLELVTGVGMALKVYAGSCAARLEVLSGGKTLPLDSLHRGDRLRVVCRAGREALEAIRIEWLSSERAGGAR